MIFFVKENNPIPRLLPKTYKGREIVYDILYPVSKHPKIEGDKVRMNPQFGVDLAEGRA